MKPLETRSTAGNVSADGQKLLGYAVVYGKQSKNLGGFVEIVRPGALTRTLRDNRDVFAFVNHDAAAVLGRTTAGTLKLEDTRDGLRVLIYPPDNETGRGTVTSVARGDVSGMSFSFRTVKDEWHKRNGLVVRELIDVDLFEVSVVTIPAYPDTVISVSRSATLREIYERKADYQANLEMARRRLQQAMV